MNSHLDNYKESVNNLISYFIGIINNKIRNKEICLSFPSEHTHFLGEEFIKEAKLLFNSILKRIGGSHTSTENGFRIFYSQLPKSKQPKLIATSLICYLLNWNNIKKKNFSAINLTDLKKWMFPESLEHIHDVFQYTVKIIKQLNNYGSIYLPRSKYLELEDYDELINLYLLNHLKNLRKTPNLTKWLSDNIEEDLLRFYDDILHSINPSKRSTAVGTLLKRLEINNPNYIAGALIYYYLQQSNQLRIGLVPFSKILRLPRKSLSMVFNSLGLIIEEYLGYKKITSPFTKENCISIRDYEETLKKDAKYLIKVFQLPPSFSQGVISMFHKILISINPTNKTKAFAIFYKKLKNRGLGSLFTCSALLLALLKIKEFKHPISIPDHTYWAKKIKISSSRLSSAYSIICTYLIKNSEYKEILKFIPSSRLNNNHLSYLIKTYIKEYSKYFQNPVTLQTEVLRLIEDTLHHVKGDKKLKILFKSLPSGTAQPHLLVSVYIFIYLTYMEGNILQQKKFVKELNHWVKPKICYHVFNDLHYYLTSTFFGNEREEHKRKMITSRNFYHKGQIYKFKVNRNRLSQVHPEIKKGLYDLFQQILKRNLPQSFFKCGSGYRASDLYLKGDKHIQLFTFPKKDSEDTVNLKEHLIDTIINKKEYDSEFILCTGARKIIQDYMQSGRKPPEDSYHEPILSYLLQTCDKVISIETPIWKQVSNSELYFTGHIDLLLNRDDTILVCDYKQDIYEIYKSLPQIATYGILLRDMLSKYSNVRSFRVRCLSFCENYGLEFEPEIIQREIKNFVELWHKTTGTRIRVKGTKRRLLEDITKLISVQT